MRIAILGATSEIAKDLILYFSLNNNFKLFLYARRPEAVEYWLKTKQINKSYIIANFSEFNKKSDYEVIINFVGVGDPKKAVIMGAEIFDITLKYDELALSYLYKNPNCRYIFLSSGAVYGSNFKNPPNKNTKATIPINNLNDHDWYGVAKLHTECRHRSLKEFFITDLRLFNYFSHTQDINGSFLINSIFRSILSKEPFITSNENIARDYIGALDFYNLILCIINSEIKNYSLDCYTLAPVKKIQLLKKLQSKYHLTLHIKEEHFTQNPTGHKLNYFSKNYFAENIGYKPKNKSLDLILKEFDILLSTSTINTQTDD